MNMEGGNTCDNIGYIIAPMGLSERQILIYQKLYEKCNFQDMTVKYTIDQLACDIKIADIPVKTIYKNIQIMIKKGYLEVVKKASKGNAPTYKIIKISELTGEPKVNQERTKGEPKPSNSKALNGKPENQRRTKGEPKFHPIKEKEKENNIYSLIFDYWISKNIKKHRELKDSMKKAIDKTLKEYSKDEILEAISNYSIMYNDQSYQWCIYQWGLDEFLLRKDKDGIRQLGMFLNNGSKYINYLKTKEVNQKKAEKKLTDMF